MKNSLLSLGSLINMTLKSEADQESHILQLAILSSSQSRSGTKILLAGLESTTLRIERAQFDIK